jgi:hypothetical protein
MKALDISGERYGRLTALHRDANRGRHTKWIFACDCGSQVSIFLEAVRNGRSRSCGCLRDYKSRLRSFKHGHSAGKNVSKTLKAYARAKSRCMNVNDPKYPSYGARGIVMCDAWTKSFGAFLSDMGECLPGTTLRRIDLNGNYDRENCVWKARRDALPEADDVLVVFQGKEVTLEEFARIKDVNYRHLRIRVKFLQQSAFEAAATLKASTG